MKTIIQKKNNIQEWKTSPLRILEETIKSENNEKENETTTSRQILKK